MRVSSPRSAPKPEPGVTLSPLPMAASSMMPGKLYIWSTKPDTDGVIVMLNQAKDGFVDVYNGWDWYFDAPLSGKLYGPITLLP